MSPAASLSLFSTVRSRFALSSGSVSGHSASMAASALSRPPATRDQLHQLPALAGRHLDRPAAAPDARNRRAPRR